MLKRAFHFACAILFALAFVIVLCPAAFAAEAVAPATSIDLHSIVALVIAALAAAITAAARVGTKALASYLETKSGIELDDATRGYLNKAIDSAVSWATLKASQSLDGKALTLDVKNDLVAHAVNYLLDRVPDALDHFGLKTDDLEQLVEARLLGVLNMDPPPAAPAS